MHRKTKDALGVAVISAIAAAPAILALMAFFFEGRFW